MKLVLGLFVINMVVLTFSQINSDAELPTLYRQNKGRDFVPNSQTTTQVNDGRGNSTILTFVLNLGFDNISLVYDTHIYIAFSHFLPFWMLLYHVYRKIESAHIKCLYNPISIRMQQGALFSDIVSVGETCGP